MKGLLIVGLLLALSSTPCVAQRGTRALDGESVVRRIEQAYAGINDYTVQVNVTVKLEHLRVPPTTMTMYFKQPDKVHFDSKGFAMMPRQLAGFNMVQLRRHFSFEPAVRVDTLGGLRGPILILLPKDDRTRLQRVQVLVDTARWVPLRVRLPLLDGRVATMQFSHQQVQQWWLFDEVTLSFAMASGDSSAPNLLEQITPTRRPQQPRDGTVVLRYANYAVNTGLRDDLFPSEPKQDDRK